MPSVDLNADLGENSAEVTVSDDDAMLRIVTSANVSCGVHAGDPEGITATLRSARAHGVAAGAHPSYDDREGFGRRPVEIQPAALQKLVERQLADLAQLAADVGVSVAYVKPHGALYNRIMVDEVQARAVLAAMRAHDPGLPLLAQPRSRAARVAADLGTRVFSEVFADRAYADDGTLVARTEPGAVLHEPKSIAERMLRLLETGWLLTAGGRLIRTEADSICVHGDSPAAVASAAAIRALLSEHGIDLRAFAP